MNYFTLSNSKNNLGGSAYCVKTVICKRYKPTNANNRLIKNYFTLDFSAFYTIINGNTTKDMALPFKLTDISKIRILT